MEHKDEHKKEKDKKKDHKDDADHKKEKKEKKKHKDDEGEHKKEKKKDGDKKDKKKSDKDDDEKHKKDKKEHKEDKEHKKKDDKKEDDWTVWRAVLCYTFVVSLSYVCLRFTIVDCRICRLTKLECSSSSDPPPPADEFPSCRHKSNVTYTVTVKPVGQLTYVVIYSPKSLTTQVFVSLYLKENG